MCFHHYKKHRATQLLVLAITTRAMGTIRDLLLMTDKEVTTAVLGITKGKIITLQRITSTVLIVTMLVLEMTITIHVIIIEKVIMLVETVVLTVISITTKEAEIVLIQIKSMNLVLK
jgi:hypothetical protein